MGDETGDENGYRDRLVQAIIDGEVAFLFSRKTEIVLDEDEDVDDYVSVDFGRELFRTRDDPDLIVQRVEVRQPSGEITGAAGVYSSAASVIETWGVEAFNRLHFLEDSPEGLAVKRMVWPPEPLDLHPGMVSEPKPAPEGLGRSIVPGSMPREYRGRGELPPDQPGLAKVRRLKR